MLKNVLLVILLSTSLVQSSLAAERHHGRSAKLDEISKKQKFHQSNASLRYPEEGNSSEATRFAGGAAAAPAGH